ncbi:uncharacterized protein LOC119952043 isoform X2 [Scyliorhinus canicula]|uniref:uncharacterized protein LOC119952043 isoform X2 n=1 Tax=Scyliorhinus canicula TaxID=7830 RepID=UPI0018F3DE9B|nr:uncharacterized protein LOC119952043 isoform X2 [Scyliorhinus canicula]
MARRKGLASARRMESGYCKDTPFTDSAYMREIQRRRDNDYMSRLRLKELERMQAEQKREQRAAPPLARPIGYASRNYERPWINGMNSNRKMDIVDTEGRELQHSPTYPRSLISGRGSRLPSLHNIVGKKQKVPEQADVPEIKGGPDHGVSFQAQRLQLKSKRGPAITEQLLLKVPGLSSAAGMVPGSPTKRTQSGDLCCGEEEEEEEDREGSTGARGGGDDEPEPPAPAVFSPAESVPVPPRQPPAGGKCQAEEEEAGARDQEPGEQAGNHPPSPTAGRLCRQQTNLILHRLRQERLSTVGTHSDEEVQAEEVDDEKPPVPPRPLSGTTTGLPTATVAAATNMASFIPAAVLGDHLPFRLRVRQWATQEKGSGGGTSTFSRVAGEGGRSRGEVLSDAEEEEAGKQASLSQVLRPPQAEPVTASRGTQTFRRHCPTQSPQRPAPQSPPPPPPPLLLPRLDTGRLVSLLVTTTGASPGVATAAPQAGTTTASLARLQPISATRLGATASGIPSWGQMRDPPLSMTILALSDLRAQEGRQLSRAPAGNVETRKEARDSEKPRPDPETLRKLQESLLHEDSEEEEGDLCRICLIPGGTPLNPLLEPCKCVGSLQYVHHDCLKKWLQAKIISGADLATVTTCELCKRTLKLDFDNFDVYEFHRKRAASQVQGRGECAVSQVEEQMTSSSLYMAVLLHLYEQRFTELMRLLGGSATTYQFSTADSQPGADGSDIQNSDSEEEDGADLQSRGAIMSDGMLLTFEQRDA